MKHIGLFEGIGGFSLAARWMGWETIAWCEINEFCQKVLRYHFPKSKEHHDIKQTDFSIYRGQCNILTGGFPCQPYSTAGLRKGKEDDRHLWPEMLRAIREIQPDWVVGENVRGLISWNGGMVFDEVQADLENEGYEIMPFLLPASGVNAPHQRERIWFIAINTNSSAYERLYRGRCESQGVDMERDMLVPSGWIEGANIIRTSNINAANSTGIRQDRNDWERQIGEQCISRGPAFDEFNGNGRQRVITNADFQGLEVEQCQRGNHEQEFQTLERNYNQWGNWPTQSPLCNGNDGISSRLDGITFRDWREGSIQAGGNAIVPQVAYQIYKAIDLCVNTKP